MFMGIAAVLFDLDGTLIDSAPDLGAAADAMRIDRGLSSLPLDSYRPMAGAGARGMLAIAFGMAPEHPDFPEMREEFFRRYEQRMTHATRVFDAVPDMLTALAAHGIPWGIVTNKSSRFTDPLVRAIPLLSDAGAVVSGDTTPHAKPHPAPLLDAARRMDVDPTRCVYIGDDERDIVAGLAAGMATIAAAWGYLGSKSGPAEWGADSVANSPSDVLKWLETA